MTANSTERLHALDAVRGFALLLGVAFHATLSFLPSPQHVPLWIVMDSSRSLALAVLFHVLHTFRMTVFFLIAGFFAHMSLHKRGTKGFVLERLKRIGIPLVVGWPVLIAAILAVSIWGVVVSSHGGPMPPSPRYAGFPAFPLTHLWFLYVLLLLYAGTLLVRGLAALVDRQGALGRGADALVRGLVRTPLGPAILAAPTCVALCLRPAWTLWFGIPTPDSSLVPNLAATVAFSTAFGFGFLLHRQPELLGVWRRRWALNLAAAVGLSLAGLAIVGPVPVLTPAAGWSKFAFAGCYTLAIWTWSFGLIGAALRFLSGFSPARRYIADASYWLYMIHLPIIMALQVAVSQLDWPWFVKFPVILAVAFPLMFASYALLVRHSFIGALLNGRRPPRQGRTNGLPSPAESASPV